MKRLKSQGIYIVGGEKVSQGRILLKSHKGFPMIEIYTDRIEIQQESNGSVNRTLDRFLVSLPFEEDNPTE